MEKGKIFQELDHVVNCCNGRVGRQILEQLELEKINRDIVLPTGVEILRRASDIGAKIKDTVNCCNGRVGRSPMEEIVNALGGN